MPVVARLLHPVHERVLRSPLQARVDRELQGRRLLLSRYAESSGDAAQGVDRDLRLDEPLVQERVVRGLYAALADGLARLRVLVRTGLELVGVHLAEQAEELAAEGALWVATSRLALDLEARKLVAPLQQVRRECCGRVLDHGRRCEGRLVHVVADARDEQARARTGEPGEAADRAKAVGARAPGTVFVPTAERGRVGVDDDVPGRAGDRPLPVVHDRAACAEQGNRPERLAVRTPALLLAVQHLDRPRPQEKQREALDDDTGQS